MLDKKRLYNNYVFFVKIFPFSCYTGFRMVSEQLSKKYYSIISVITTESFHFHIFSCKNISSE